MEQDKSLDTETQQSSLRETSDDSQSYEIEVIRYRNKAKFLSSIINIHPLLFCIILADGLSASVIVNFVIERSCQVHFHFNASVCKALGDSNKNVAAMEKLIQPYALLIITAMSLLSTILPVFMSLFLGPWSDKNGRKLLLIVPTIGYSLKYLLLAIFSLIPNLHPMILFFAELPVAFSGGITNLMTAAFAYICDISKKSDCTLRIGILESVMLGGNIIGYLSSAPLYNLTGNYSYLVIFGVSSVLTFSTGILTYFFVAESMPSTQEAKGLWYIFDLELVKELFKVCWKKRENYRRAVIFLIIISMTNAFCAMIGESNIKFMFTRLKFNWDIEQYSEWVSITDGILFLGFLLGSVLFNKWIKIPDAILGIMSFVLLACSNLFIAFVPAKNQNLMYFVGCIKMFSGFFGPAGKSLISKSVAKEELGKVFSFASSCECIFPLAAAPLYTLLYNYTLNTVPETIFFVSTVLYVLNILFFLVIYLIQKRYNEIDYENIGEEVVEGYVS